MVQLVDCGNINLWADILQLTSSNTKHYIFNAAKFRMVDQMANGGKLQMVKGKWHDVIV